MADFVTFPDIRKGNNLLRAGRRELASPANRGERPTLRRGASGAGQ